MDLTVWQVWQTQFPSWALEWMQNMASPWLLRDRLSGHWGENSRSTSPRPNNLPRERKSLFPSTRQDKTTNYPGFSSSVLFCKFIQSIPDNHLVRQKLNCMTKIVESNLFQQSGESPAKMAAYRNCLPQPMLPLKKKKLIVSLLKLKRFLETGFKEKVKSVQHFT